MELIEKFRKLLNSFSNKKWQIIAGEMLAETPSYPFVEMFVINLTPDFHNQSIEVLKKENGVLTEQNIKTYNSTLQFNCRHKTMNLHYTLLLLIQGSFIFYIHISSYLHYTLILLIQDL